MLHRTLIMTAAALLPLGLSATAMAARPNFQVPFPCGQTWSGQTRTNHSPAKAVDFNRSNDEGDPVASSKSGTVVTSRDLGSESYGRYLVVDHGGGWSTLYAHLSGRNVQVGDNVLAGTHIGWVGSTGGSTGPHLHFEERSNGSATDAYFDGEKALYWGTKNYTSNNCSHYS